MKVSINMYIFEGIMRLRKMATFISESGQMARKTGQKYFL